MPEEQRRTLDAARQIALNYSAALPDFICSENVKRVVTLGVHSTSADSLTLQLTYFGQHEKYKVVTLNGNSTQQSLESLGGLISGGEFGSLLLHVFEPASEAAFEWKSSSDIRKRRAAVYTYRVSRAKSHYVLGYHSNTGKLVTATAGYQGEVFLDSEKPKVLRITARADDLPKESGILLSTIEVDYDFQDVAGRSYLLPAHSEAHMKLPYRETINVASFVGYRKFQAESTIDFTGPGR